MIRNGIRVITDPNKLYNVNGIRSHTRMIIQNIKGTNGVQYLDNFIRNVGGNNKIFTLLIYENIRD